MVDGWKTISGKKYYLDNGCMASGLTRIGDKVYYFNKDGALVTNQQGWKKLDADSTSSPEENEFFLYNDGTVKTGFMTVGDVTYGFDDYGYLMKNETGYNPADSRYYLFDENGKMIKKKGWVSAKRLTYGDGSSDPYYRQEWFYLNPDYTIRLNGLWNINGTNYAFNLEGAMMSGQMVPYIYDYDKKAYREVLLGEDGKEITSNGWHKIKSEWYYYNAGKIFYDKIAVINGSKYAFDYDGKLKVNTTFKYDDLFYKADSDGRLQLAPKGWNKVETYGYTSNAYEWYYLSETGKVSTTNSWITSGKDKYYISNGRMATGVYFIDDDYDYYVFADD